MYLSVMTSKYGTDYVFSNSLIKAQQACDNHSRILNENIKEDRFSYKLGPYDRWEIYEVPEKEDDELLTDYLNELFNLVHVNPENLKKIEFRGLD